MNQYNLYNLEASFKKFLISGNKNLSLVSLKNYLSDLRHFFAWFFFTLKSDSKNIDNLEIPNIITNFLNKLLIARYKTYLVENNVPVKSANRRLSTIRKLCKFFLSQGWIKENPSKEISNISLTYEKQPSKYYVHKISLKLIFDEYKKALQGHKNKNIQIEDVNDFFSFIS